MKPFIKQLLKTAGILAGIAAGTVLAMAAALFLLGMAMLFNVDDYLVYRNSLSSKEEMIQMFYDNREEYERLAKAAEKLREESGEDFLLMSGKKEFKENGLKSSVFKKYPVCMVTAKDNNENGKKVSFEFKFCPAPYIYWGIYHVENREPSGWGEGKNMQQEEGGGYVQELKGSYRYETEEMAENWYFYQCWVR